MTTWYAGLPAPLPPHLATWRSGDFRDLLHAWVGEQVGPPRSVTEVKLRPWAGVWHAETAEGRFYVKQNCAPQASEAAVVRRLAAVAPAWTVPVVASEPDRGLLLTEDLGPTLRDGGHLSDDDWRALVEAAAELQRSAVPVTGSLVEDGLTEMNPEDASSYAAARVDQLASLPASDPRHLAASDAHDVLAALPLLERGAEEVAALGLPATVQHNDLHEGNALRRGTVRFFDFADAVVAPPLSVLHLPLNRFADLQEVGDDDPKVAGLAESYLEHWSDLAPLARLRAALPAARRLATLAKVESWLRVSATFDDAALAEWGTAVPSWLRTLADT